MCSSDLSKGSEMEMNLYSERSGRIYAISVSSVRRKRRFAVFVADSKKSQQTFFSRVGRTRLRVYPQAKRLVRLKNNF